MSLKGWGLATLAAPVTLGLSLLFYFYFWFFTKIGKFYIRGMVFSTKAFVGLILLPFKVVLGVLGGGANLVETVFHDGVSNLRKSNQGSGFSQILNYKLRYLPVGLSVAYIINYQSLLYDLAGNASAVSTIGFWVEFGFKFFLVAVPLVAVVLASAFSSKIFGGAGGQTEAAEAASGPSAMEQAAAGVQTAREAKETVDSFNELNKTAAEAEELEGLGGLLEGSAFEGLAAGGAGSVAIALVVAWVFYTVLAAVISGILVIATWAFVAQLIPIFAAPVLGAMGVGNAYLQWAGTASANIVGPQLENAFEVPTRSVEQAFARLGCIAERPQCIRQWRLNNTVRPGSDAQARSTSCV
jgi:hypothetical protein